MINSCRQFYIRSSADLSRPQIKQNRPLYQNRDKVELNTKQAISFTGGIPQKNFKKMLKAMEGHNSIIISIQHDNADSSLRLERENSGSDKSFKLIKDSKFSGMHNHVITEIKKQKFLFFPEKYVVKRVNSELTYKPSDFYEGGDDKVRKQNYKWPDREGVSLVNCFLYYFYHPFLAKSNVKFEK